MEKGRMKVRVLSATEVDAEALEEELNDVLQELAGHYIVDVKPLTEGLLGVFYLSEKRSSYKQEE